jgi:uncharacterized protein with ACT and thioredoxin-like domain
VAGGAGRGSGFARGGIASHDRWNVNAERNQCDECQNFMHVLAY